MNSEVRIIGDRSEGGRRYNKNLAKEINQKFDSGEMKAIKIKTYDINGTDRWEYVKSLNLYVSKVKELYNNDWWECQDALIHRGDRMVTPYEFCEFFKHLRMRNSDETNGVIDDICTMRNPTRTEWLDVEIKEKFASIYYFGDEDIRRKRVVLRGEILMNNKKNKISLNDWLNNNVYGIPKKNISLGNLNYDPPRVGRVGCFWASVKGVGLDFSMDCLAKDKSIGVRAVRHPSKMGGRK